MVIEEKQKNGAQLFFTSNIENYIIKGELIDERSKGFEPAGPFSEAMVDQQNMRDVLEIILGKDVVLKHLPQTEKEARISPAYRFAKVDVWAKDTDEVVYDTEVQGTNTKNLPKRSRYYESIIDAKLLKPGERDFNKMNDIYIILIAPFDLFGKRKYMYTFEMTCK